MLKAVKTPNTITKLINYWNIFQVQVSLIPRGSTGSLKMRDSLKVGTARYGRKRLVIGSQEL